MQFLHCAQNPFWTPFSHIFDLPISEMDMKKELNTKDESDPDAHSSDIDVDDPDDDTVVDLSTSGCCSWCHKPGPCALISDSEMLGGRRVRKRFCSERCFGLHRRAMFKKNKRCEWCHTGLNEAEASLFGLSGLQFCRYVLLSEKI